MDTDEDGLIEHGSVVEHLKGPDRAALRRD